MSEHRERYWVHSDPTGPNAAPVHRGSGSAKCVVCTRPVGDGALCGRCEATLTRALAEVPAVAEELDVTVTRQTAQGAQEGGRSAETVLPVNLNASEVADNLKATLVGWVRDLEPDPTYQPEDTLPAVGRWLYGRMSVIRVHPAVDAIHDEVTFAVREAWRICDRPANRSRVFVAGCLDESCVGELWASFPTDDYDAAVPATHARMTCTVCPVSYPAEQWLSVGRRLRRAS